MTTNRRSASEYGYDNFLSKALKSAQDYLNWRNIPAGSISARALNTMLNATTSIEFTASDADTVAWTTGKIYFANGTDSGTLPVGNTGNMTLTTYIYFDRDNSSTLQITTDPSLATGLSKLAIARIIGGDSTKLTVLI